MIGIEEVVIEVGTLVSVAGLVVVEGVTEPPTQELGFRDTPPRALKLSGDLDHPLLIGPPERS